MEVWNSYGAMTVVLTYLNQTAVTSLQQLCKWAYQVNIGRIQTAFKFEHRSRVVYFLLQRQRLIEYDSVKKVCKERVPDNQLPMSGGFKVIQTT